MAAKYQHLSPAFLADAAKLLDSSFAEAGRKTAVKAVKGGSIVTKAEPSNRPHRMKFNK